MEKETWLLSRGHKEIGENYPAPFPELLNETRTLVTRLKDTVLREGVEKNF